MKSSLKTPSRSVATSCPTLAHRGGPLALAARVLCAALPLFGCSDPPLFDCAAKGLCASGDAGDAPTPDSAPADAASADAGTMLTTDAQSTIDAVGDAAAQADAPFDAAALGDASVDAATTQSAPPCDPTRDPKDQPCLVSSNYGVFVATSGRDGGAGDQTDPALTVTEGIAVAVATGKSRVFVCQGTYAEAVALDAAHDGISVFGGFDCLGGWAWTGAATTVTAPAAPSGTLHIDGATQPIAIEDLAFVASDAVGEDTSGAGRSSIAALVHASTVRFARVALTAGRGADGAPGADGVATPNFAKVIAPSGAPAGADLTTTPIGTGGFVQCLDSTSSTGGSGGPANWVTLSPLSFPGASGTASPASAFVAAAPFDGAGGIDYYLGVGDPGANGLARPAALAATTHGLLSAAGWQPSPGSDGLNGYPAQGGGGGAGDYVGFAGSGGGAGGCGGSGGKAGAGGGASIALVSIASSITLSASSLTTFAGGAGGAGGTGEAGQGGGAGGLLPPSATGGGAGPDGSTPLSAPGGAGGNGAGGGGGAGGAGGLSVGIVFTQGQPATDPLTSVTAGAAGTPGGGGAGGAHGASTYPTGNDGAAGARGLPGVSAQTLAL